ncbi:glycosyltransferase [Actinosynnema sp. NPDC023794]
MTVVIPTYNRQDMLRETLGNLARQTMPVDDFEVVVSDDGSSDETRAVVEEASRKLRIKYHFQPDEGYRVALARNAGARLASAPLLVFLDTGVYVGPSFLDEHVAAHAGGDRLVVVGYTWGYDFENEPVAGLAEAVAEVLPEDVVARFSGDEAFYDARHAAFAKAGFDLGSMVAPWVLLWALNFSVRTEDYWRVDGFDDGMSGWGLEDIDMGFRLFKAGLRFQLSRTAWAVHAPHERSAVADALASTMLNMHRMMARFPEPATELAWNLLNNDDDLLDVDEHCRFLNEWTDQAKSVDVAAEVAELLPLLPPGRLVVFGAGRHLPDELADAVTLDFDADAVRELGATYHAIGIRTPLPDKAVDVVVLTSRLAGLWPRWSAEILAEAARVGGSVKPTPALMRETTTSFSLG